MDDGVRQRAGFSSAKAGCGLGDEKNATLDVHHVDTFYFQYSVVTLQMGYNMSPPYLLTIVSHPTLALSRNAHNS